MIRSPNDIPTLKPNRLMNEKDLFRIMFRKAVMTILLNMAGLFRLDLEILYFPLLFVL